ncbi:hypothetical protein ACFLU4_00580 [Chloroflexota bacterium]
MAKTKLERVLEEVATISGDISRYILENHPKSAGRLIDGNLAVIYFSCMPTVLTQELIEFPSSIQHPNIDKDSLKETLRDCKKKCKAVGMDKEGRQYLENALQRTYDLVTPQFHG